LKSKSYGTALRNSNALEAVEAYPNPLIGGKDSDAVTFKNLPRESKIMIYTAAGILVDTLNYTSATDGGSIRWNTAEIYSGI